MNIRILMAGYCVAILLTLGGCAIVTTSKPVGTPISNENVAPLGDRLKLDGAWTVSFGEIKQVWHVRYEGEGRLAIAKVNWTAEKFQIEELDGLLTQVGEQMLLNTRLKHVAGQTEQPWTFLLLSPLTTEEFLLVPADPKTFTDALARHELEGEILNPPPVAKAPHAATRPAATAPASAQLLIKLVGALPKVKKAAYIRIKSDPQKIEDVLKQRGVRNCFTIGSVSFLVRRVSDLGAEYDLGLVTRSEK
jgi:hypothetical protein